jgi:hypothetical protein
MRTVVVRGIGIVLVVTVRRQERSDAYNSRASGEGKSNLARYRA